MPFERLSPAISVGRLFDNSEVSKYYQPNDRAYDNLQEKDNALDSLQVSSLLPALSWLRGKPRVFSLRLAGVIFGRCWRRLC